MQAVFIKGLAEFSTSVAIASSIWLLRKKKRWNRLRMAWRHRWLGGPVPEAAVSAPAPLAVAPSRPVAPVRHGVPATRVRASRPVQPLLAHIEVVEDTDWQLWEAAVASQNSLGPGHAA